MKTSNITKSALALALGLCASGALAVSKPAIREDFSGDAFAGGINGVSTNNLTWADTEGYSAVSDGKLVVDAADTPTSATITNTVADSINDAIEAANRTASFTADVSFTPSKELVVPGDTGNNLKFALYAYDDGTTTNLYVYNGSQVNTGIVIPDTTARAVSVSFGMDNNARAFKVSYNGTTKPDTGWYSFKNDAAISTVEFAGNGTVDNIGFDYDLVDTTITWPTTLSVVSYTVDGVAGDALVAGDGTKTISTEPGAAIVITGTTPYGATVTASGTAGTGFGVTTTTSDLAWYFPQTATAGQDGTAANPYEIDSVNALVALAEAVDKVSAARSLCYVQVANIDFANATFAGIGIYADNPTAGTAFAGTYDGQNYKISNIAFEAKSYAGVFNQVNGGTIKNLTVNNATGAKGISIVGNAGNGATLQNLVAEGSFGSSSAPAGHNAAGIVIRLSAGGTGTLVKDCTNNATIYGSYTKLAGICTLTQIKETGGSVTFDGCVNKGNLTMPSGDTAGRDGLAGIVAYAQDNTILKNCANTGTITSTLATAKKGELIGYAYEYVIADEGNNSASSSIKMIGYQNAPSWTDDKGNSHTTTVNGFKYATVAGDVATTISGSPAAGGSYLLEGNATPSVSLAYGETVTFDTSLGYTLTETGITTSATGCEVVGSGTTTRTFSVSYVSVAVSYSAALTHLTAAWTVNGSSVAEPATLTYGDTYSVTFTAESGWAISDGAVNPVSGTAGTTAIVITVPAVEELPSYAAGDTTVIAGHTLTAAEASYLNTLVGNTSAAAVESALASIDEDDFVAATVLNQDITKADAGSYEFNVTKIKKSGGTVKVTVKLTRSGTLIGGINGTLVLQTCATPTGTYADAQTLDIDGTAFAGTEAEATAEFTFTGVTDKFFKAVIR